jgi:hypothetical protein
MERLLKKGNKVYVVYFSRYLSIICKGKISAVNPGLKAYTFGKPGIGKSYSTMAQAKTAAHRMPAGAQIVAVSNDVIEIRPLKVHYFSTNMVDKHPYDIQRFDSANVFADEQKTIEAIFTTKEVG